MTGSKKRILQLLTLGCLWGSSLAAYEIDGSFQELKIGPYHGNVYIDHVEGKGLGYHQGYSSLGGQLFTPRLFGGYVMPFVDLRAHVFNDGKPAANVGLGARYASTSTGVLFGGNIYYDYRQGKKQGFSQLGLGFEIIGRRWDLTINGYLPLAHSKVNYDIARYFYPGGYYAECAKRQSALGGVDMNVGVTLWERNPCECWGIYFTVGPYYYVQKCCNDIVGGRAQFEVELWDYVSVELRGTYDNIFRGGLQGVVTLSFPLYSWLCADNAKKPHWRPCPTERDNCRWVAQIAYREEQNCLATMCDTLGGRPVDREEMIVLRKSCYFANNFSDPSHCSCSGHSHSSRSSSSGSFISPSGSSFSPISNLSEFIGVDEFLINPSVDLSQDEALEAAVDGD